MADQGDRAPWIDSFWEMADVEGSDEHPLARELSHRMDAIARYGQMISEAVTNGNDYAADQLRREQAREERVARDLRDYLRRMR